MQKQLDNAVKIMQNAEAEDKKLREKKNKLMSCDRSNFREYVYKWGNNKLL